jgi:hypothetical protein
MNKVGQRGEVASMAVAGGVNIAPDDRYCLQVDLLASLDGPSGVDHHEKDSAVRYPDVQDTQENYRREVVAFLNRAGFPVSYLPAAGGMGSATGPAIVAAVKAGGLVVKTITGTVKAAQWFINSRAKQRRNARHRLLTEFVVTININKTGQAVLPALAVLPELVDHLQKEFPQIQPRITLSAHQASDYPCHVSFEPETVGDKQVLAVIKRLEKNKGRGTKVIGYRRGRGFIWWPQRKESQDLEVMWQFMHPDKKREFPPVSPVVNDNAQGSDDIGVPPRGSGV